MKSKTGRRAVMGAVLLVAGMAGAADVELTGDVASAYVFRGATLNDGPVFQPALNIGGLKAGEKDIPLTLGAWGNLDMDDYGGRLSRGEFSEIDLYADLALPSPHEALGWTAGYIEYVYPGGAGADREFNLALSLDAPLAPSLTASYGTGGAVDGNWFLEAGVGHEVDWGWATLSLGAGATWADPKEGAGGFSYASGTVGLSRGPFHAAVTYIGQLDDDVLPHVDEGGLYDVGWVFSVGVSKSF